MKAGWNPRLAERLQASDPTAHLIVEAAAVASEDTLATKSDWNLATKTGEVSIGIDGSVRLGSGDELLATSNTSNDWVTRLSKDGLGDDKLFDCILLDSNIWFDDSQIQRITVTLAPRLDAGVERLVDRWRAQLYRVTGAHTYTAADLEEGEQPYQAARFRPMGDAVSVPITSDAEGPVTFDFRDANGQGQTLGPGAVVPEVVLIIEAIPKSQDVAGTPRPVQPFPAPTYYNVGLAVDTTLPDYDPNHLTDIEVRAAQKDTDWLHPGEYKLFTDSPSTPKFELWVDSYTPATLEQQVTVDPPTEPGAITELVARGEIPGDSALVFEVSADGASWTPYADGDVIGEGALAALSPAAGSYHVRATLQPGSGGYVTPALREIGARTLSRINLDGLATVRGLSWSFDPADLTSEVSEATVVVVRDGPGDAADAITELLAHHNPAEIEIHLWVGAADLPRADWLLVDVLLLDDYDPLASSVVLTCISILAHLSSALPQPRTTEDSLVIRETLEYIEQTISAAYTDILEGHLDLPARRRGAAPAAADVVTKRINDSSAKVELGALARLAQGTVLASQGRIRYAPVLTSGAVRAVFGKEEIKAISTTPGLRQRVPEYYVPYDWDEAQQRFRAERRVFHLESLEAYNNLSLDAPKRLDEEVAKWIPASAAGDDGLAQRVGGDVVDHLGSGLILWSFLATYPHPYLEAGDLVVVNTEYFVAKDPSAGTALRGESWALGVVQEIGDPLGTELGVWVRSYADIIATSEDVQNQTASSLSALAAQLAQLSTDVETTWRDGIIDETDRLVLEADLKRLSAERAAAETRYAVVAANPALPAASKTALDDAWADYAAAHDALTGTINTAITPDGDGVTRITDAEREAYEAAAAAYPPAFGALAERLQEAVDAIKDEGLSDLDQELAGVEDDLQELTDRVNAAFGDGTITSGEAAAIAESLKKLDGDYADTESAYTSLDGNALLRGTAKSNLESAWANYTAKYNALVAAINNAIADGVVTDAEHFTYTTATNAYTSALGTFSERVQEAQDAIAKSHGAKPPITTITAADTTEEMYTLEYSGALGEGGAGALEWRRKITVGDYLVEDFAAWAAYDDAARPGDSVDRVPLWDTLVHLEVRYKDTPALVGTDRFTVPHNDSDLHPPTGTKPGDPVVPTRRLKPLVPIDGTEDTLGSVRRHARRGSEAVAPVQEQWARSGQGGVPGQMVSTYPIYDASGLQPLIDPIGRKIGTALLGPAGTGMGDVEEGGNRGRAGLGVDGLIQLDVPLTHAVANVPGIDTASGRLDTTQLTAQGRLPLQHDDSLLLLTDLDTSHLSDGAGLGTRAAWSGVSGAGRPADNATVGATWGSDVADRPSELTDGRVGAGLDPWGLIQLAVPLVHAVAHVPGISSATGLLDDTQPLSGRTAYPVATDDGVAALVDGAEVASAAAAGATAQGRIDTEVGTGTLESTAGAQDRADAAERGAVRRGVGVSGASTRGHAEGVERSGFGGVPGVLISTLPIHDSSGLQVLVDPVSRKVGSALLAPAGTGMGDVEEGGNRGRAGLTAAGLVNLGVPRVYVAANLPGIDTDSGLVDDAQPFARGNAYPIATDDGVSVLSDGATVADGAGRARTGLTSAGLIQLGVPLIYVRTHVPMIGVSGKLDATQATEAGQYPLETADSLTLLADRTADHIEEGATRKWAAESGAERTAGKSIDILVDGTYQRPTVTQVGYADRAGAALDANSRLSDQRRINQVMSANISSLQRGLSISATWDSTAQAYLITASEHYVDYAFGAVPYAASSVYVGPNQTAYLYYDDPDYQGGSLQVHYTPDPRYLIADGRYRVGTQELGAAGSSPPPPSGGGTGGGGIIL